MMEQKSNNQDAKSRIKGFDEVSKFVEKHKELIDEDELYREALRATCSLCILEGRCCCGELDEIEEEEEDEGDWGYFENDDEDDIGSWDNEGWD